LLIIVCLLTGLNETYNAKQEQKTSMQSRPVVNSFEKILFIFLSGTTRIPK